MVNFAANPAQQFLVNVVSNLQKQVLSIVESKELLTLEQADTLEKLLALHTKYTTSWK